LFLKAREWLLADQKLWLGGEATMWTTCSSEEERVSGATVDAVRLVDALLRSR